jgi:hypothetical protein
MGRLWDVKPSINSWFLGGASPFLILSWILVPNSRFDKTSSVVLVHGVYRHATNQKGAPPRPKEPVRPRPLMVLDCWIDPRVRVVYFQPTSANDFDTVLLGRVFLARLTDGSGSTRVDICGFNRRWRSVSSTAQFGKIGCGLGQMIFRRPYKAGVAGSKPAPLTMKSRFFR